MTFVCLTHGGTQDGLRLRKWLWIFMVVIRDVCVEEVVHFFPGKSTHIHSLPPPPFFKTKKRLLCFEREERGEKEKKWRPPYSMVDSLSCLLSKGVQRTPFLVILFFLEKWYKLLPRLFSGPLVLARACKTTYVGTFTKCCNFYNKPPQILWNRSAK